MEVIFRFGKDKVKQKRIDELTEEIKRLKEELKTTKLQTDKENLFDASLIEKGEENSENKQL